MRASNYKQVLSARGYKCKERSKYQGISVFEKEHRFNKIVCTVIKDSHGKGQTMSFAAYNTTNTPQTFEDFHMAEFDRSYLVKEAHMIHDAFEQLKTIKAPKHIVCF